MWLQDVASGEWLCVMHDHTDCVTAIEPLRVGNLLATGCEQVLADTASQQFRISSHWAILAILSILNSVCLIAKD